MTQTEREGAVVKLSLINPYKHLNKDFWVNQRPGFNTPGLEKYYIK
jgi:hypothetical protein